MQNFQYNSLQFVSFSCSDLKLFSQGLEGSKQECNNSYLDPGIVFVLLLFSTALYLIKFQFTIKK